MRQVGHVTASTDRRRERAECCLGRAGREPQRCTGGRIERARPARDHHHVQPAATRALAHAEVEDRRLVDELGVDDQHVARVVDVGHARREVGPRERARLLGIDNASDPGVDVRRAEHLAHQELDEVALLVGGLAAHERGGVLRRAVEPLVRLLERALPRDRAQLAAVAHERLGDPLRRMHHLVAEAALVAEPAVVDLGVVARHHAQHLGVVADGELDVALRRAERADRAGLLDVPGPRTEAVGARRQGAHGAELHDVAAERRHVRAAVVRADVGVVGALEEHELEVLGDLLREAHAAVAEDAALAVDRDER